MSIGTRHFSVLSSGSLLLHKKLIRCKKETKKILKVELELSCPVNYCLARRAQIAFTRKFLHQLDF